MRARILIVEDNPVDEVRLRRIASRSNTNIEVVVVTTYEAAMSQVVNPDDFDVIFADYYLPGSASGADLARESGVPTVVMTSETAEQIKQQAARARAVACVAKDELYRDEALMDELIRLAQTTGPGHQPTALETAQKTQIEQQAALIQAYERKGLMSVLSWIGHNKGITFAALGVVALGIAAAILIGKWPG